MNTTKSRYFKENIFPQIKDFDFVKDVKEYDHSRKGVSLNFDTLNINDLSSFKNIETIHCFRLTETQIEDFPQINSLKHLNLSGSPIKNLNFLKQFPNITYLDIDGCNNLVSIKDLSILTHLRILSFLGNMKLTDFSDLSELQNIISLTITGTTSGSILKMDNLEWIRNLNNLEELNLNNISTPKNELKPISLLRNLRKLGIPEKSKVEQIAYLSGSLPKAECFYFSPFYTELDKYENLIACSQCGESKIRLVGKGKNRVICKKCDINLFDSHMEIFNIWQAKGFEENKNK